MHWFITLYKFHLYSIIFLLLYTLACFHHQKFSFNLSPFGWPALYPHGLPPTPPLLVTTVFFVSRGLSLVWFVNFFFHSYVKYKSEKSNKKSTTLTPSLNGPRCMSSKTKDTLIGHCVTFMAVCLLYNLCLISLSFSSLFWFSLWKCPDFHIFVIFSVVVLFLSFGY